MIAIHYYGKKEEQEKEEEELQGSDSHKERPIFPGGTIVLRSRFRSEHIKRSKMAARLLRPLKVTFNVYILFICFYDLYVYMMNICKLYVAVLKTMDQTTRRTSETSISFHFRIQNNNSNKNKTKLENGES